MMPVLAYSAIALAATTALGQSSEAITRSTIAEMLADAQSRSSLLAAPGTSGYDEGFFIASPGGDTRLDVNGHIEFRYTANLRDDNNAPADDRFEGGFTLPTAALDFSGHLLDAGLVFNISAEFEDGGAFVMQEAYAGNEWENGWGLYWGQAQLPVLWEDVIDGESALAVDVSVVNGIFNPGDAQGVWLHYAADAYRVWLAFSDGADSANTEFNDAPADYAFTTRNEFLLAGAWDDFEYMSSMPGSEFGAKLGLAAHWQDGPNRPGIDETSVLPYTADLLLKGDGWNFYAAYIGRYTDESATGDDFHDIGLVVQGGVLLPETDLELFAR